MISVTGPDLSTVITSLDRLRSDLLEAGEDPTKVEVLFAAPEPEDLDEDEEKLPYSCLSFTNAQVEYAHDDDTAFVRVYVNWETA